MAAPTFVSHTETSAWDTTTTPKTISVDVQAGDIIVVGAANGGGEGTFNTPTNDGAALTWTQKGNVGTSGSTARCAAWTTTADSTRTVVISLSAGGTSVKWGGYARVWRSSDGVGNAGTVNGDSSANFSASITTTQANSAIDLICSDWNATTGTRTYLTTGVGTFTEKTGNTPGNVAGAYSVRTGYYADAGSAAAKTVGTSAPTGEVLTIVAVEIKGSTGGSTTPQALTATVTSTASVTNLAGKVVTATATTTATITKRVAKTITGNATVTATLTALKVILLTLQATATSTATITKRAGKQLTVTLPAATASIIKQAAKPLSATVTSTATLSAIKVILLTLSATVTATSTIVRKVGKTLSYTATATPALVKQVNKPFTATVTSTASMVAIRVFLKTLTATVTSTASMTRRTGKLVNATVTTAASVTKRISKALTATVTAIGDLLAQVIGPQTQDPYPTLLEYTEPPGLLFAESTGVEYREDHHLRGQN